MYSIKTLDIYLGKNRKHLLIILNLVLIIFIILEMMIWNQVNGLLSAEEVQEKMNRF